MAPLSSHRVGPRRALGVLVLACGFVAACAPAGASAASPPGRGRLLGIVPHRGHVSRLAPASSQAPTTNLIYHNGPVMHTNRTYAIYWKPSSYSQNYSSNFKTIVNQYFADVAADSGKRTNVYSSDTQYYDSSLGHILYSSTSGGAFDDGSAFPNTTCAATPSQCVTDAQIQTEVDNFVAAHSLPRGVQNGATYFVLTPPGIVVCDSAAANATCSDSPTGFCAYHGDFDLGRGETLYAAQPYPDLSGCDPGQYPNGDAEADAQVNLISHEHNETITDPQFSPAGWYDSAGNEDGDKCAWGFGAALGGSASAQYNQLINGHGYWLQREWSNLDAGCVQRFANRSPTASFTLSPSSAATGTQVSFNGSGSSDSDGSIASYSWDFGDGNTGTGATPTHTYATPNTYTVTLTVTDNDGATGTTSHTVTATNRPPTASFTLSPSSAPTGTQVSFNGSGSSDPDGTVASYNWDFGDGNTGTGASPTHTYATPNTYTVTLTVTDNNGATGTTSHTLNATNRAPTASFTLSPNPASINQQVTFDATTSSDPDGSVASYSWNFGDGSTGTGVKPSHAYSSANTYTVTLTVTDNKGLASTPTTNTVTVSASPPPNQLPTASFTSSPNPALTGQPVSFDASASKDPDGTIVNYSWNFGDGGTGTGINPGHTYASPAAYTVQLTVTDNSGGQTSTTRALTVDAAPNNTSPPTTSGIQPTSTPPLPVTTFTSTQTPVLVPTIAFLSSQRSITVSRKGVFSYSFTGTPAGASGSVSFGTAKAIAAAVRKRKLSLGSASFTARGPGKTTVTIRLSRTNFAILKRKRSVSVKVTLTIGSVTRNATFTLKAPKR